MIANSYVQFGWLAPRRALMAQEAPDTVAASAVLYPDRLDAILRDLHAMRQSLDRIAAAQEQITRSNDEIATNIAARQPPTTRSTDQTATTVATGQGQMTRNIEQTATSVDQAPSAKANSITVESRNAAVSLQVQTLTPNLIFYAPSNAADCECTVSTASTGQRPGQVRPIVTPSTGRAPYTRRCTTKEV